ncbi:MAG: hypothetical protein LBQ73_03135, partial [Tannerellaceae bacterium]|nr:hypothetical protein [Tannerellaceae bacterium]
GYYGYIMLWQIELFQLPGRGFFRQEIASIRLLVYLHTEKYVWSYHLGKPPTDDQTVIPAC